MKPFDQTVAERLQRNGAFRSAVLAESVQSMFDGDLATAKSVLRDYIHATVGFTKLGAATGKSPKSLMRMFGRGGNPQANNLFEVLAHLQKAEGITLQVKAQDIQRKAIKRPSASSAKAHLKRAA